MRSQLQKIAQDERLIEFYTDMNNLEKCGVGKVLKVSEEFVVLANITPTGMYDGYCILDIEKIIQMNLDSKYLNKIKRLYTVKGQTHIQFDSENENLLLGFLEFTQKNGFVISVELFDSGNNDVRGFIKNIEEDILIISAFTSMGEPDGETIIKLKNISSISCDDEYESCVRILSLNTGIAPCPSS